MARAMRSAWPPLALLTMLSLAWITQEVEIVNVQTPVQVIGLLNKSVMLPCSLPPEGSVKVTQVTWLRGGDTVAVFHPEKGAKASERLRFVAGEAEEDMRNASVVLSNLKIQDEANYTCQFALYPVGSWTTHIWLRVMAPGQNTAEALKDDHLALGLVPVATCISAGCYPPSQITWSSDLGGTFQLEQKPGPEPGTFTMTSLYFLKPSSKVDGKNITCKVEHESLEEPLFLLVTLSVHYLPEVSISGYDGNWYHGRSGVNLTCDARSNPKPKGYSWSTTAGPLPPSAKAQGKVLLIHTVDKSVNTTFVCRVTNDLGTSQNKVYTPVAEAPKRDRSGLSENAKIGITVSIVIVLVILAAVLCVAWSHLQTKHPGQSWSGSSVESRAVQYSVVSNGVNLPRHGSD
uniref:poliovirus receptor n=1 Tax=Jaculus jaculus TaxID=51337 RepID=UPI001E1B00CB|nr:poliovirus receptor [Jaculus jaculus]